MPLHDFYCGSCRKEFEELHRVNEPVHCGACGSRCEVLVGRLADYTGQASKTVQYATRKSPIKDSHIQKLSSGDTSFLRNGIKGS
jgi:putative FmdB family regulatory protein